jgi:hypothetical protein
MPKKLLSKAELSRAERAAKIALAKRLRSMIPDPSEFEGDLTPEERTAASEFFCWHTLHWSDKMTRDI